MSNRSSITQVTRQLKVFSQRHFISYVVVFRSANEKRTTDKRVSTMLPQAKHALACSGHDIRSASLHKCQIAADCQAQARAAIAIDDCAYAWAFQHAAPL